MKQDLRVLKTKRAIKEAFLELVETIGFNAITIRDIVEKAEINRNTFYLHYSSKEDLMEKLLKEDVVHKFQHFDFAKILAHPGKKELTMFFTVLMEVIENNMDILRIYFTDSAMAGSLDHLTANTKGLILNRFRDPVNKVSYTEEYLFAGLKGILATWIRYAVGSKEEVISTCTEVSYPTIKAMAIRWRAEGRLKV